MNPCSFPSNRKGRHKFSEVCFEHRDLSHWRRIYSALETTKGMSQHKELDHAIQNHTKIYRNIKLSKSSKKRYKHDQLHVQTTRYLRNISKSLVQAGVTVWDLRLREIPTGDTLDHSGPSRANSMICKLVSLRIGRKCHPIRWPQEDRSPSALVQKVFLQVLNLPWWKLTVATLGTLSCSREEPRWCPSFESNGPVGVWQCKTRIVSYQKTIQSQTSIPTQFSGGNV